MPLQIKQAENGFWYIFGTVTVWKNGQSDTVELRKSTRTKDKSQADGIRRQIENEAAERNITGKEPAITFREAAKRYKANGGEERFLAIPIDHLGDKRIDAITQQMIDDIGAKVYGNTATRRRQFHAPIIAVLRSNGINSSFRRPPDGAKRTFFLRPLEAVSFIEAISSSRYANPWSPALATFLFGQGARVSEALGIDGRQDVSLEHKYAILRDTKNGNQRTVSLCPRVIAALSTIPNLGERGPLFMRYDGRPYHEREGRGYKFRFWDRAMKDAGHDPEIYTPHTARHSFGTWFYSQTLDVVKLRSEGGWLSDEWQRYVQMSNKTIGDEAYDLGFKWVEKEQPMNNKRTVKKAQNLR
jgi:integrase